MPLISTMNNTNLVVVKTFASSLENVNVFIDEDPLKTSNFEDDNEFDFSEDELLAALDSLGDDANFPDLMDDVTMDFMQPNMENNTGKMSPEVGKKVPVEVEMEVASPEQPTYRQAAISRWMEKRKRRTFRKKVVCRARGEVAQGRPRVGGRFVKSQSTGWVAITSL